MTGSKFHPKSRFMARFPLRAVLQVCCIFAATNLAMAESQVVDRIVAVVNDDIIVLQDLNQMMGPLRENLDKSGQPPEKIETFLYQRRKELLDLLVDQKLMLQTTKRYNITASEKEIDNTIERMKAANQLTDESLREALKNQGTTMAEFRNSFREQILLNRIEHIEVRSRIVITEADIKAYYDSHSDKYGGKTKYHLRHLLMTVSPYASPEEKAAVYRKMEAAQTALAAGEPFAEVVKGHADREYADAEGELGQFALEDLAPRLKTAVEKLAVGQSTPILAMPQGYQIIHLEEIVQTTGTPLSEVSDDIEEMLLKEAVSERKREWIDGLRKQAHIKITN